MHRRAPWRRPLFPGLVGRPDPGTDGDIVAGSSANANAIALTFAHAHAHAHVPTPTPSPTPTPRPTPTPTARPAPTSDRYALLRPCPGTSRCWIYRVRAGDNIYSIANYFGVTQASIYDRNPFVRNGLRPGQDLRLPPPTR